MKIQKLIVGVAIALSAATAGAATTTVKIVSFNDFHGTLLSPGNFSGVAAGGADYVAGYIADYKRQSPYSVIIHAGDMIGASPLVSAFFHDEGAIEVMNRAGVEFASVGNHEFDEGRAELLRMQNGGCHPTDSNSCKGAVVGTPVPFEGAKFKFLSANVVDTASGKTLFPPFAIKSFNTPNGMVRVGFIGMTLKDTPTIVTPAGVAGLRFDDEAATVNKLVPALRARGVEAIVVVLHQGAGGAAASINGCGTGSQLEPIRTIVSNLDDAVDLVISGHSHLAYNCQLLNKAGRSIPVTQASSFGRVLTDIDLTIDNTTGNVTGVTATNRVVDRTNPAIAPNASVANIVAQYGVLAAPIAGQVIGSITADLPNTSNDAACNVLAGNLIADSQLAATSGPNGSSDAVIAFMNRGGIRSPGFVFNQISATESAGEVTYGEAFTVQPFGNTMVTMTITAQDIKNVLEQQFAGCRGQAATATRIMIPSAGFKYTWDGAQACDARIRNVSLTAPGGVTETIVTNGVVQNPAKQYRVSVNNFMATGGDGFTTFLNGTNLVGGAQDIDALVAYMTANFKSPNPAYAPGTNTLDNGTPRINRLGGTSCPTGANVNP